MKKEKKLDNVKRMHDLITKRYKCDYIILEYPTTAPCCMLKGFKDDMCICRIAMPLSNSIFRTMSNVMRDNHDYSFIISTENPFQDKADWNIFIKALYRGFEPSTGLNLYKGNTTEFVNWMIYEEVDSVYRLYEEYNGRNVLADAKKYSKLQIIKTWEELAKLQPVEGYRLNIDLKTFSGEVLNDKGEMVEYLSTHTFYEKSGCHKVLQKYGWNVYLKPYEY